MGVTNFYEELEVPRTATQEEIRKSFRKKSLQYHPDRNDSVDASSKFQAINEAYQTLSDPDKRRNYNMLMLNHRDQSHPTMNAWFGYDNNDHQTNGMFKGVHMDEINPELGKELFNNLFGQFRHMNSNGGHKQMNIPHTFMDDMLSGLFNHSNTNSQSTQVHKIHIDMDNIDGMVKDIFSNIMKNVNPKEDTYHTHNTHNTHNVEHIHEEVSIEPDIIVDTSELPETTINIDTFVTLEQIYNGCEIDISYVRMSKNTESHSLHAPIIKQRLSIPPGFNIESESPFMIQTNNDKTNVTNEKINVHVHIKQHDVFKPLNHHLILKHKLTLREALTGFTFNFTHINGKTYTIKQGKGNVVSQNTRKKIPNLGMPINSRNLDDKGDLVIEFDICFPESLTETQCNALEHILV